MAPRELAKDKNPSRADRWPTASQSTERTLTAPPESSRRSEQLGMLVSIENQTCERTHHRGSGLTSMPGRQDDVRASLTQHVSYQSRLWRETRICMYVWVCVHVYQSILRLEKENAAFPSAEKPETAMPLESVFVTVLLLWGDIMTNATHKLFHGVLMTASEG